MWRWILVNLLTLSYTSTQPISDHDGQRECCPCPKPADMATLASFSRSSLADDCPCRASVLFSNPEGGFTPLGDADQALAGSVGDGAFIRSGVVDDCPCRFRDVDSVGAPSVFFPSAVRALWPGVSNKETKEDAKPLLHPEVGLASSVLETLREATDEEYQEVLARDAVRSVLQAPDIEVMSDVSSALDTARDIVNVILKPSDIERIPSFDVHITDSNSEASNVQESRCIHPLGRSKGSNVKLSPSSINEAEASNVQESRCIHPLGRSKGSNVKLSPSSINEIFTKPRKEPVSLFHKKNIWDMDSSVGASNMNEQIFDGMDKTVNKSKLNTNPSLLSLFQKKSNDEPIKNNNFKPFENSKNTFAKEADNSRSPLDQINMEINNSISDFKFKLDNHLQSIKNDNDDKLRNVLDSISSPSVSNLVRKPILPSTKFVITTIKPYPLKSLLKLKDVELVPPVKTLNANIPKLIPSSYHKNKDSTGDIFKHFKTTDLGDLISNGLKISFRNKNGLGGTDNIQPIPKDIFKSDIVDAQTSPSEIKMTINKKAKTSGDCDNRINDESLQKDESVQLPNVKNTEIIENVPIPTEINKQQINDLPATTVENVNELKSHNFNDLFNNVNERPNTEIIDTVPSPSQVQPVELTNENKDTEQEHFNDVSRDDFDCKAVITNEGDDSSVFNDSDESNRDDVNNNDFENDQENIEEMNDLEDSDTEAKEFEEKCFRDSLNQQDSVPAASSNSPNEMETESEQIADLTSGTNHESSDEACVEEVVNSNPLLENGTKGTQLDKLKEPENKETVQEDTSENSEWQPEDETVQNEQIENKPSKSLEIQDLQNRSDKLLDLSSKKDQEHAASENFSCMNLHDSHEVSNDRPNSLEQINASLEGDITENFPNIERGEAKNSAEISTTTDITDKNKKFEKQLSCTSDFDIKHNSDFKSNTKYEMKADSSDTFVDRVKPESLNKLSLLHNVLHPNLQNIGSNLKGPNLDITDKLNLKLPSLDNVRKNLASILQPNDNFGFFNLKEEKINDDSNTMSVDASAPSFKSVLPSLQPLEDIDLDIFQFRPLSLPGPQKLFSNLPSLPPLNLNSYKAKLALPKGFNLKPMKLESSFGGKNGLLGATLTVRPNKGSKLNNPLAMNNIPTLEELHTNIRENAQNFLLTPIDITGRNIIDDSLRSSQTLTDNIRSHAKNTVKDIQQTFATTLRDVKQSDLGILGEPLNDPKEFLQAVSRTHEDFTDKLKAIQYDFNDRLESIRDHITDQSLLPTLNAPMVRQSSFRYGPEKFREKPSSLSNSYRKPNKNLKTRENSKPQSNSRLSSFRKKPVKGKNIKQSAAPSIPVPKTVEAPKLRTVASSSPPPFLLKHPSLEIPQLLTNKKSLTDMLRGPVSQFRDSKIPILGKNKVKISFGSTTLKPDMSRNKPSLASRPPKTRIPTSPIKQTSTIKNSATRIGSKLRPSDSHGATSIVAPTKLKAPLIKNEKERPVTKTIPVSPKFKSLLNRPQNIDNKFTNGHAGMQFPSLDQSQLRSGDSLTNSGSAKNLDILSSLREAVRVRLSNLTPLTNDKIVQPDTSNSDMLRSASENVESKVDGLMKENASYTCKMMCTRNN